MEQYKLAGVEPFDKACYQDATIEVKRAIDYFMQGYDYTATPIANEAHAKLAAAVILGEASKTTPHLVPALRAEVVMPIMERLYIIQGDGFPY